MATLDTLAKARRRHPLKAPCLHPKNPREAARSFSQIGTSIIKKQKERALSLPGKLPAPNNSRDFLGDLGAGVRSRELMPDVTASYGHLSESAVKYIDC